jgi:hypothetical protein
VLLRFALSVFLGLLLPACGLLSTRNSDSASSQRNSEIALEVESHHWSDIVVYLMNGSQSERLGMVNGLSSKQFVFPFRKLASGGRARLRAYAIGGAGSITSEDLLVQPGQWIKWTLESDLDRSSLAIH